MHFPALCFSEVQLWILLNVLFDLLLFHQHAIIRFSPDFNGRKNQDIILSDVPLHFRKKENSSWKALAVCYGCVESF